MSVGLPVNGYGVNTTTKVTKLYNNQFFDYLSEQMPRNHVDMFKWCEMVFFNSPVLADGLHKAVNYAITNFVYKSDSPKKKEETRILLEEILDMRSELIRFGYDYHIYGNGFRSMYFPFTRFLKCKYCGCLTNVNEASFVMKRGKFVLSCQCGLKGIAEIEDVNDSDLSKLRIVSWNQKRISLVKNPISGSTKVYYSPDGDLRKGLMTGNLAFVADTPSVFFEACSSGKKVEFGHNMYHFKTPEITGFSSGWGVSPLLPTLKLYMYTAILRKSVEAIGLEHITPQRILFPQGTSNDPSLVSNMSDWTKHMTKAVERWRSDPNYIMLAPFPTGVVNVGSQGRALMPTNEIKAAEEDMLRALHIPPEFVYGSSSINNSSISLRVMENELTPYVSQMRDFTNWVIRSINDKYDKDYCEIDFTPFTLSDDLAKQQMLLNLAGNGVSKATILEGLGINPEEENAKVKEDSLRDLRLQKEIAAETAKEEASLSNQAIEQETATSNGTIPQYDQQKLLAQAQQLAQQLLSVPYEQRRSYLAQLQNEDYVMWALVSKQLDTFREKAEPAKGTSVGSTTGG